MSIFTGTRNAEVGGDLSGTQLFDEIRGIRFGPRVITALYLVVGFLLLFFSDYVLPQFFQNPLLAELQAVKGGIEILLTGVVIFALSHHGQSQLQEQNEAINQQRKELAVLHRVLRHNLRNAMNVIHGHGELIRSEAADEKTVERAETIERQAEIVMGYTEKANKIRRLRELGRIDLDLAATAQQIVEEHPEVDETVVIDLDIDPDLEVRVNPLFEDAMSELITNSIQHKEPGTLEIEVAAYRDPDDPEWVILEAMDNGPGVIADVLEVMKKGNHSQLMHLEGLGLWFVYWTVIESGGSYDIEVTDGTKIKMRLPSA